MAGFRGIFLDGIHPNIVRRLDRLTYGMQRLHPYSTAKGLKEYRYMQERTPWVRTVPFAIPQTIYRSGDPTKKVVSAKPPHWRNWILYGAKAAQMHGSNHQEPTLKYDTSYSHNLSGYGMDRDKYGGPGWTTTRSGPMYRESLSDTYEDSGAGAGVAGTPAPGIVNLNVSNKGDMGTIRRCSFDIKAYSLADVEALEMMYMVPGLSVLVEWGWFHPDFHVEPIEVETITDGKENRNTQLINETILKKTFDVDDLLNLDDPADARNNDPQGPRAGIYDGLLGVITKFSWNSAGDGTYDIKIDLIAPGSLSTGITCESYALGGKQKIESETDDGAGQEVSVNDIRIICSLIKKNTIRLSNTGKRSDLDEMHDGMSGGEDLLNATGISSATMWKDDQMKEEQSAIDIPNKMLDLSSYSVDISVTGEPPNQTIEFTVKKKEEGDPDILVGDYKGGKAFKMKPLTLDPKWWLGIMQYMCRTTKSNLLELIRDSSDVNDGKLRYPGGSTIFGGGWGSGGGKSVESRAGNICNAEGKKGAESRCLLNLTAQHYNMFKNGLGYSTCSNYTSTTKSRLSGEGKVKVYWKSGTGTYQSVLEYDDKYNGERRQMKFNNWKWWFPTWDSDMSTKKSYYKYGSCGLFPAMVIPGETKKYCGIKHINADHKGKYSQGGSKVESGFGVWDEENEMLTNELGEAIEIEAGGDQKIDSFGTSTDDRFMKEKIQGVSLYVKDGDNVTPLSDLQGWTADDVTAELEKAIAAFQSGEVETFKSNEAAALEIEGNLANIGKAAETLLSWRGDFMTYDGSEESGYKHGGPVYCPKQSMYSPKIELGYDLVHDDTTGAKGYPIGGICYGETYVSWRFIEDYIINELYMPKNVSIAEDDAKEPTMYRLYNNSADKILETTFSSVVPMTTKEKHMLIQGGMSGISKETRAALEGQTEIIGDDDAMNDILPEALQSDTVEVLTQQAKDVLIHQPVQIVNHPNLRSYDPLTCILPGQEDSPVIKITTITEGTGSVEDGQEEESITGPANREERMMGGPYVAGDDYISPILAKHNLFPGFNTRGERTYYQGILRNILINIEVVQEAAEKAENVRKFMMTILDAINTACGKPWDFKIINLPATGTLRVVDANFCGEQAKRFEQSNTGNAITAMSTDVTSTNIYMFSGIGGDNICRDVKISSKIPQELQTMAYFGAKGSGTEKGAGTGMFNAYRVGMADRLSELTGTFVLGSDKAQAEVAAAEAKVHKSYVDLFSKSRVDIVEGLEEPDSIKEGVTLAADWVQKYIHGNTVEVGSYRPPIPIDVGIELDGISGIYMGNAIMLKTVDDGGILPSRYKGTVALQATAVDHAVTPEGWTTSIETLMRPLATQGGELNVKVISNYQEEDPLIDDFVPTGNEKHPNADHARSIIAKMPAVREKENTTLTGPGGIEPKKNKKPKVGEMSSGGDITKNCVKMIQTVFTALTKAMPNHKFKISAGNDYYHIVIRDSKKMKNTEAGKKRIKQGKKPNYTSKHTYGNGIDFVVSPCSKADRQQVSFVLAAVLWANTKDGKTPTRYNSMFRYINEYAYGTAAASGGHFHISVDTPSKEGKDEIKRAVKIWKDAGGTEGGWMEGYSTGKTTVFATNKKATETNELDKKVQIQKKSFYKIPGIGAA